VSTAPVVSDPRLTVIALSDSFEALWPALAAECGFALSVSSDVGEASAAAGGVVIVSGGGMEEALEGAVRECVGASAGGTRDLAAVGALADHRVAVTIVRASGGAAEYFALPGDHELLRSWMRERADRVRGRARRSEFAEAERERFRLDGILGESVALRAALDTAWRVIPHAGVTVLLTGETGTGKELVARAMHYHGPRREGPFVDVNCAAIPEQLLESELFGHEKGAFTDASSAKPGLFEMANGGTLFLDEIGHLARPLQGKLLRVLQEREIRRVGGTRSIPVDVRVIAATHVDLAAAARNGEFREDLFFRLNVIPIELPPLRARPEDVLPLARHFLGRFAHDYALPPARLTKAAEKVLSERDWPGNVRELRNAMERAVVLARDGVIDAADVAADRPRRADGADQSPAGIPFPAPLRDVTRGAVVAMLALCRGNKSEAARRLEITRPRLQRILDAAAATTLNDEDDDA
jgi:two-component system, NtrC family, response regulator HydG